MQHYLPLAPPTYVSLTTYGTGLLTSVLSLRTPNLARLNSKEKLIKHSTLL